MNRLMHTLMTAAGLGGIAVAGVAGYAVAANDVIDVLGEGTTRLSDGTAAYSACPGESAIGELHRGDRVLLTGRDDDGSWFEVRSPIDLLDRVWVPASAVTPDAAVDLPVVGCGLTDEELALASGEVLVTETTTTTIVDDSDGDPDAPATTSTTAPTRTEPPTRPTTPPTVPPTTPSSTPPTTGTTAPQTTTTTAAPPAPSLGTISRSTTSIYEDWPGACDTRDHTSLISVPVQNATSVTMGWNLGPQPRSRSMSVQAGVASATLGPFDQHTVDAQTTVTVTVRAVGAGGQQVTRQTTVTLNDCYFG